jgi:hypothetical protein
MSNTLTTNDRHAQRWAYQGKYLNYSSERNLSPNKKFYALYGIFRRSPNGEIEGYVENSFSMGWSDKAVLTMNHSMAIKDLNKMLSNKDHKPYLKRGWKYFIYRVTRKSDKAVIQVTPPPLKCGKYEWRNWKFSCVENIPF